jgi:hypothetical protein
MLNMGVNKTKNLIQNLNHSHTDSRTQELKCSKTEDFWHTRIFDLRLKPEVFHEKDQL